MIPVTVMQRVVGSTKNLDNFDEYPLGTRTPVTPETIIYLVKFGTRRTSERCPEYSGGAIVLRIRYLDSAAQSRFPSKDIQRVTNKLVTALFNLRIFYTRLGRCMNLIPVVHVRDEWIYEASLCTNISDVHLSCLLVHHFKNKISIFKKRLMILH